MTTAITPVIGTTGSDQLTGGATSDVISGLNGNDTINANSGNDLAHGGGASDLINGSTGDDVLYGGGGPGLLSMTAMTMAQDYAGRVTFISEGAGFQNSLMMYRIAADGQISGVTVLFANASATGSGGSLVPGKSYVDVPLKAGETLGFMIASNGFGKPGAARLTDPNATYDLRNAAGELAKITDAGNLTLFHVAADGTRTAIQTQYGTNTFHSAADPTTGYDLNADRFAHTVGRVESETGNIVLGFEDLWAGGDKDFDDIVFRLDVGTSNARVLDPNLVYGEAGEGNTWIWDTSGNRVTLDGRIIAPENDTIYGGSGNDRIYGGVDHDRLYGGDGNDTIDGNSGADSIWGDIGNDVLSGGKGNDVINGGVGNDLVNGDSGNDSLLGSDGNDTLNGGDGDDTVNGETGNDMLYGGAGNDAQNGGTGNDTVDGGSGEDLVIGGIGQDVIFGGSGRDVLNGGDGQDSLFGGADNDILRGDAGNDSLDGGSGNDTLNGGTGNDALYGGSGSDLLEGGSGNDLLRGGTEDDVLRGSDAADIVWGDTGNDQLAGDAGNDQLFGGDGNDILSGGDGNDMVEGGKGNDQVSGGIGNDQLLGGEGNDQLDAGLGINRLSGGLGADTFVFAMAGLSRGQITDFDCSADRLALSGLSGTGLTTDAFFDKAFSIDAAGTVHIAFGDMSIDIANRFGVSDFATQVWDSLSFV